MTYKVYDAGAKFADRYTILRSDGAVWGASQNPSSPVGVGQYCGDMGRQYKNVSGFGRLVKPSEIPPDVKKYADWLITPPL